jgi:hypothetical protein
MKRTPLASAAMLLLIAAPVLAEPARVGDTLEPFSLEDQHGETRTVDASVRAILFSRDMDGGTLIKDALADEPAGFLEARGVVYVADINGMPRIIARLFALPSMRKRSYEMLLDRDGTTTAMLPDEEGRATLIRLDALRITAIASLETAEDIDAELATLARSSAAEPVSPDAAPAP